MRHFGLAYRVLSRTALIFALVAISGCSIKNRSDEFACQSQADCPDGRQCSADGWCVVGAQPAIDAAPNSTIDSGPNVAVDAAPDPCETPMCNDGVCCAGAETACDCPADCASECGDGCCLEGEDPNGCPEDCAGACDLCDDGSCSDECQQDNECDLRCRVNGCECDLRCGNSDTCNAECRDNTSCLVRCENANRCEVECRDEASCILRCGDADTCKFSECEGGEQSCPGNIIVCNLATCPTQP